MEEGINVFSIKDLENFSGIKAHTIRIWEKRYRILEPERTDSNIRTYGESELKKILNVAYLNRHGIKISRIALLNDDQLKQEVIAYSSQDEIIDADYHPGKILLPAIKFNDNQFLEMLLPLIRKHGMEKAYISYLCTLLEKSRILWQTGSLSRAQEQFIRYTIRQILINEDSNLKISLVKARRTVAMINPSDSMSDNNFLFYKYALRKRGYDVIFTGGVLPPSEVKEIYKIKPFNYLVVNSGTFDFTDKRIGYFSSLGKSMLIKKIIFTDFPENPERGDKNMPDNIIISKSPRDFINLIDSIR